VPKELKGKPHYICIHKLMIKGTFASELTEMYNMINPDVRNVTDKLLREIEREVEGFISNQMGTNQGTICIDVDVLRRGDNYVVYADMPGYEKSKVNLYVSKAKKNVLVIEAERNDCNGTNDEYIKKARRMGACVCEVSLPDDAETTNLQATMNDGVLQVIVKRSQKDDSYKDMQRVPIM
jgi:HSP20 family protein